MRASTPPASITHALAMLFDPGTVRRTGLSPEAGRLTGQFFTRRLFIIYEPAGLIHRQETI